MKFEDIQHRTIDDAGCAIWQGSCGNGYPTMRHHGRVSLVRRVLWEAANGPIPTGMIVHCTCGAQKCVELSHMELTTRGAVAKKMGAMGVLGGIARRAAIARTRRAKHAKLTEQDVAEIRLSEAPTAAQAVRYGVSPTHINRIKAHTVWRDFSSPWAGL